MELNKNYQMIRELKGLEKGPLNNFKLDIYGLDGEKIGYFLPVGINLLSDEKIIRSLTEWRTLHKKWFFTQFNPTLFRTKQWLKTTVIPDNTKILFIIYDINGNAIGNYGLRDISKITAELDNILLDNSKRHGPFVLIAMKSFINWVFVQFGFKYLSGAIFKHNEASILVHKRLGFKEIGEIPVRKINENNMIQYVPVENGESPDAIIIEMCLKSPKKT